jgi:hypothetical protein
MLNVQKRQADRSFNIEHSTFHIHHSSSCLLQAPQMHVGETTTPSPEPLLVNNCAFCGSTPEHVVKQ